MSKDTFARFHARAWQTLQFEATDKTFQQALDEFKAVNPTVPIYQIDEARQRLLIYFGGSDAPVTREEFKPLENDGWTWRGDPRENVPKHLLGNDVGCCR